MKKKLLSVFFVIFIVALCFIGKYTYSALSDIQLEKQQKDIEDTMRIKNEEISNSKTDYDLIIEKNSSFQIINIAIDRNWTKSVIADKSKIEKTYKINGIINRAYLYIEASVENKQFSSWDNIYFSIRKGNIEDNNKPIGGHLIKRLLLPIPSNKITDNKSYFLYKTDSVPYYIIDKSTQIRYNGIANFFDKINQDWQESNITIEAFIDSPSKNRKIHKLSFYYECQVGTDCIEELN